MKHDLLFVVFGSAVLCGAVILALTGFRRAQRSRWPAAFLWALLGAGLLVQGFAPHLEIKGNAFVMPSSLLNGSQPLDPAALVALERKMQLLSCFLTVVATLGLAFQYRHSFIRRNDLVDREPLAS